MMVASLLQDSIRLHCHPRGCSLPGSGGEDEGVVWYPFRGGKRGNGWSSVDGYRKRTSVTHKWVVRWVILHSLEFKGRGRGRDCHHILRALIWSHAVFQFFGFFNLTGKCAKWSSMLLHSLTLKRTSGTGTKLMTMIYDGHQRKMQQRW